MLPNDIARCAGIGSEEDGEYHWREGCDDCLRRTSPPSDSMNAWMMSPPEIIAFECEFRIATG